MAKAKTPKVTPNKQVIQMPEPGTTTTTTVATPISETKRTAAPKTTAPVSIDLQGEIRRRAYELYEKRGRTPGYEQEDWAQAEREIFAGDNQQQSA